MALRTASAERRCKTPQIPASNHPLFGALALPCPLAAPRPHDTEHDCQYSPSMHVALLSIQT